VDTQTPILRGAKIIPFLLAAITLTVMISISLARPTQAEPLNLLGCLAELDCVAPAAPTITSPTSSATVSRSNAVALNWNAVQDPSGVTYTVCLANNSSFTGATCKDGIAATTYNAAGLIPATSGSWNWRVTAVDGAGNTSTPSATGAFTVDAAGPAVSGFGLSRATAGGTAYSVVVTANADDPNISQYKVVVTNSGGSIVAQSPLTQVSGNPASILYAFDVTPAADFPSGAYTATLTVSDSLGNNTLTSGGFVVDNDGPVVVMTGGNTIIKSGSISPTVTATDPSGIASYSWTSDARNPDGHDLSYTIAEPTFWPKVEGTYRYYLTVTDGLGNVTANILFTFGYSPELAVVPLPVIPTDSLSDKLASGETLFPASVSPSASPSRDAQNETGANGIANVLGGTIGNAPGQLSPNDGASVIAPTSGGWSIFGVLWYWWIGVIAVLGTATYFVKKIAFLPIPKHS